MKKIDWNEHFTYYPYGNEELSREITLPHDAMIYEKRNPLCDNLYNTGYYPGGKYIYEKRFTPEDKWMGKTVVVEFEGIYRNSTIYLNDERIGAHKYGFSQFDIDITDKLIYGKENALSVLVENDKCPNNRWYSGSGIYRPVNLFIGEKEHINPYGITVKTQTTSDNKALIYVDVDTTCDADNNCSFDIEITYNNKTISKTSSINNPIEIEEPHLWSAKTPNLYECRVKLKQNNKVIDSDSTRFGIRTIECNSCDGLLINDEKTFLNGGCIHHDNGILGAAAFRDAEYRKAYLIKKAGFNAIRCAHNPFSSAFLDACDEVGLYVMEEAFDMWLMHKTEYDYASDFRECYEDDLRRMVKKDINHPSVIMYSIGNEIADTASKRAGDLAEKMVEIIEELDDTRLITDCVNSSSVLAVDTTDKEIEEVDYKVENAPGMNLIQESPVSNTIVNLADKLMPLLTRLSASDKRTNHVYDKVDIAGMNYCLEGPMYFHKKYPDRVFLASETYAKDIMYNFYLGTKYGIQIGDFVWTAWDYIGEASGGIYSYGNEEASLYKSYPALLAGYGHIDITGFFTPEVYYRQIVCRQRRKPYISVRPIDKDVTHTHESLWRIDDGLASWAWNGFEGKTAYINVYSNSDSVCLYLNNKRIGDKKVKKYRATFKTEYEEGELTAISYDRKGKETGRTTLRSSKKEPCLVARAEQEVIDADVNSLAYINITIEDEDGIVHMINDTNIVVKVEGKGELMGVASANPVTFDELATSTTKSYYGRAQAIVRSSGKKGNISVTVRADGYDDTTITIKAK